MNLETISNLKFISNIQSGDKINIKFMIIQKPGIFTAINRLVYKETRINTLNFIKTTVNRSFEIIDNHIKCEKKSDVSLCRNLIQDLKLAKDGINNIRDTYIADIKIMCDFDVILERINTKLNEIEPLFKQVDTTESDEE